MRAAVLAALAPESFLPTDLSGLELWLAADRINGLVNADPVGTWLDLSGNGRSATQATAAKKPTYRTGVMNGKPVVRFDGVDDYLKTAAFTLNQPCTVFMAIDPTNLTALNYYVMDGNTDDVHDIYASDATHITLYAGAVGPSVVNPAAKCILTAVFNGASSTLAVNGGVAATGNAGASNAGGITLGASGGTFQSSGAFDLAELAICNGVKSGEEQGKMRRYLGRKWGISVN